MSFVVLVELQHIIMIIIKSELVFSDTVATNHENDATVVNLSALFLKEFYKKTKKLLTPGLEECKFC